MASVTPDAQHDDRATATPTTTWVVSPAQSASGTATGTASGATSGTATGTGSATTSASGSLAATTWRYTTTAGLTLCRRRLAGGLVAALIAPELTAGEALRIVTEAPKRADILGAGGTPLVTERDVYQVGIDKSGWRRRGAGLRPAARRRRRHRPRWLCKAVAAGGAKQFVIAVTLRRTDPMLKKVEAASPTIDGAARVPLTRRWPRPGTSPEPSSARSARPPPRSSPRAMAPSPPPTSSASAASRPGMTPSSAAHPPPGSRRCRRPQAGPPWLEPCSRAGRGRHTAAHDTGPEHPVRRRAALRTTTTPAALVAIRPSTGEILAAANGPASGGLNLATDGRFAPGSTFKIISSPGAAPLGPDPRLAAAVYRLDQRRREAVRQLRRLPGLGLGQIPLTTAVANSCNTAFISQHARVDQAALASAAAALGFGVDLDLGFPAYLGSIPAVATGTEHAASFIGQAKVAASPMVMTTVVASVLAGHTVRPVLLPEWTPKAAAPTPAAPLTTAEAASLRQLMHAVVTSGSGRVLAPAGVEVAKTGTAEYADGAATKKYTWMVTGRGDLAVAVFVKDGVSGSASAGPVVLAFLRGLAQDAATP